MFFVVKSSIRSTHVRCLVSKYPYSPLYYPSGLFNGYKSCFFSSSSPTSEFTSLRPFVDPTHSYAYGRSSGFLEYRTITHCLKQRVCEYPDRLAIISHHQNIQKTYAQLDEDVERLAQVLIDFGIKRGDVGGAWSANLYEYAVVQYALVRIGAINCSISPVYKTAELEYALQKAKHKVLFLPNRNSRQSSVNDFHNVLSAVDSSKVPDLKHLVYFESKGQDLETFNGSYHAHSYDDLIASANGNVSSDIIESVDPDDSATIYFTSGTTGKPKGAVLTHFAITNNLRNVVHYRRGFKPQEGNMVCLPLPLFHVYAGTLGVFSLSVSPMTLVLVDIKYSVKSVLEAIDKYKCTDLWLVPAMLVDINNHIKNRPGRYNLSSVKGIGAGAASVPAEVAREATQLFPNIERIRIGYGATETSAVATYPLESVPQETVLHTVGSPLDFTQIKIVDDYGAMVKHNQTGEVLIKGFTIMKEYLDDPQKTAEVIKDGWYHTGDLGTMDSEGIIKIVGRTKEMIIRGGSNVYPREIEELLHTHPDILEVAVCGVPHPKLGEEVCAWIQLVDEKNNKITEKDIKDFCREKISYYKVPAHVIFVKEFPRTLSGKFQKFKMTEQSVKILNLDQKKSGAD